MRAYSLQSFLPGQRGWRQVNESSIPPPLDQAQARSKQGQIVNTLQLQRRVNELSRNGSPYRLHIIYAICTIRLMIRRHLGSVLRQIATRYPVVTVTGPRQSGKTTLIKSIFDKHQYASLEDPDERQFALEDPRGFLDQFSGPVILDEVQHTPDLFSYIQSRVDLNSEGGQFILSGSQNFLLLRQVSQSLAGRAFIAHLLPLTLSELHGRQVRADDTINTTLTRTKSIAGQWTEIAHRGFYPRIHDRRLPPGEWLAQYFQTYLQRDVRTLAQVGDIEAFRLFVQLCAGRAGQLLNLSALGSDAGVSHETARRWLSMLEASFVVFRLQPHHQNFRKRLIKSPKLYFVDTGLLCYLLRIEDPEQLQSHAMRGAVFENLIIGELLKNTFHAGHEPTLSFWRDNRGNEVDLIVTSGSRITPVEIKSGATIASDFFKGLEYWSKLSGGDGGLLVYGGDSSNMRRGFTVRSWRQWP